MPKTFDLYLLQELDPERGEGLPVWALQALQAHWEGRLSDAAAFYARGDLSDASIEWKDLIAADECLVAAKIGREIPAWRGSKKPSRPIQFLLSYALFSSFFWKDHARARVHLNAMLRQGLLFLSPSAVLMAVFLWGHMKCIQGWRHVGLFVAFASAKRLRSIAEASFFKVPFYYNITSVFPYTVFVAGKTSNKYTAFIKKIPENLPCDPYYRSLYFLACLLNAAYSGDIADAEVYSQRLLNEHKGGHIERYALLSSVMTMLPYALRGYGHLIEDDLNVSMKQVESCKDPVVRSGYSRAAAVTALYKGDGAQALKFIRSARESGAKTGFRKTWTLFDDELERYATGEKIFNPMDNILTRNLLPVSLPPNFGSLTTRLLQVTSDGSSDFDAFVKRIGEAVGEHLDCDVEVVRAPTKSAESDGVVFMRDFCLVAKRRSQEPNVFFRSQLGALTPILRSVEQLYKSHRRAAELSGAESALRVARQVAHDIRSPLAALEMLSSDLRELPEDTRTLLRMATDRIGEIAQDLLDKGSSPMHRLEHPDAADAAPRMKVRLLATLLEQVVAEKNLACDGGRSSRVCIERPDSLYGAFVDVDASELKRVLSNTINNGLEALGADGEVTLSALSTESSVIVRIRDNGSGMTAGQLTRAFEEGVSFKSGGNGLGLFHAKRAMIAMGGDIDIESTLGTGTCVQLHLRRAKAPTWFLPELGIQSDTSIVIVDDDAPIHQLWKSRFGRVGLPGVNKVRHFTCPNAFALWWTSVDAIKQKNSVILSDYEFRANATDGVQILKAAATAAATVLVTSHFEEDRLLEECVASDIKLIPKGMARLVPITHLGP